MRCLSTPQPKYHAAPNFGFMLESLFLKKYEQRRLLDPFQSWGGGVAYALRVHTYRMSCDTEKVLPCISHVKTLRQARMRMS